MIAAVAGWRTWQADKRRDRDALEREQRRNAGQVSTRLQILPNPYLLGPTYELHVQNRSDMPLWGVRVCMTAPSCDLHVVEMPSVAAQATVQASVRFHEWPPNVEPYAGAPPPPKPDSMIVVVEFIQDDAKWLLDELGQAHHRGVAAPTKPPSSVRVPA